MTTVEEQKAEFFNIKNELKECREQLHLLTEQSLLAIVIVQNSKVVYANRAYARLTGYPLKDILGWTMADTLMLIHPDYRDFVIRQGEKKMTGNTEGIVTNYQYIGIQKNGEEQWVDQYSQTVQFNGMPADMISMINISDRKKAESALQEGWKKYQNLVENANDSILILQDSHIVFHNAIVRRETGYSDEELDKMSFLDLIHPEDRSMVIDRYSKRLSGKEIPTTYSFRILLKSQNIMWVQVNAVIINWEGKPATLCVIRDVTRLRELEAQLQESRKLEAISTLAGGLAHEFNNLLFPIIGYTEMMLDDIDKNNPHHSSLKKILTSAKRGRDIVRQFQAFSRDSDMEIEILDIMPVLQHAVQFIKSSLPSNIEFCHDIADDCGYVKANPTQLRQVIMNLATNAIQAMEQTGGRLDIRLTVLHLDGTEMTGPVISPGDYACLSIADTGPGMEKSVLDRIFEPYFTTKEQGKGTGMGLPVAHGIVRQFGGDISVESDPVSGSEFRVYLPAFEITSNGAAGK